MQTQMSYSKYKHHPRVFLLGLVFVGVIMMFVSLTSAFIVRKSAGNWLEFRIPSIFYLNSILIVLSSIVLHYIIHFYKKGKKHFLIPGLTLVFFIGAIFLFLQYQGWKQLSNIGVLLDGNVSGSFIYVISGLHAIHVVGGLTALFICMIIYQMDMVSKSRPYWLGLKLMTYYWHFMTLLWVYLIIFLNIQ